MRLAERILQSLRKASTFNAAAQAAPVCILWPDKERHWEPVISRLAGELPELLVLGKYAADKRTGPAIWLKCAMSGALSEVTLPAEAVPILYLPGVSRGDLRAVEDCPRSLQPIAELQYRGAFWSQVNAKDWTVNAFLTAKKGGLGLDVAQDRPTQEAMLRALDALLDTPIEQLSGKRLEAADFDQLLVGDPIRDVLSWMNDPAGAKSGWEGARWKAFVARCRQDLKFHPEKDGELPAAERLAERQGVWKQVWDRYAETQTRFPNVLELLRRVPMPSDMFADASGYPRANDEEEGRLRQEFVGFGRLTQAEARSRVGTLEGQHGARRHLLWARMGLAPLAQALEHLRTIAGMVGSLPQGSVAEIAQQYRSQFWRVDQAALLAMACVKRKEDVAAVDAALRALYVPWLEESATLLQARVRQEGGLGHSPVIGEPKIATYAAGICMVFVDGLRYDVAQRLVERLEAGGHAIHLDAAWTTIPSVTASGKPLASPVAHRVAGSSADKDFEPSVKGQAKALNTYHFRNLLDEAGWQFLPPSECGEVTGRAWTEIGDLDNYGHQQGLKLARDMEQQLEAIVERIQELADAGWPQIKVVTDHGWLLVPGGMPKVELPKFLAETRWGRCALLKDHAASDFLTLGWHWAPEEPIALAPGIASFIAGAEYAHGGLSLQESLVPIIDIKTKAAVGAKASVDIESVRWRGLRCYVEVKTSASGLQADIRGKVADAASTWLEAIRPIESGKASLVVPNDEAEGQAAFIVIINGAGDVLAKQQTVIGE